MTFNPVLVWFLAGLALLLLEFAAPGVIMVFFGLGAWITALTTALGLTGGWTTQLLTFGISSVLLLVLLRRWFRARFFGHVTGDNAPDHNIDSPAGQVVTVLVDIDPAGEGGRVEYKGASWQARAATTLPAGSSAVIESCDGITLVVRPR